MGFAKSENKLTEEEKEKKAKLQKRNSLLNELDEQYKNFCKQIFVIIPLEEQLKVLEQIKESNQNIYKIYANYSTKLEEQKRIEILKIMLPNREDNAYKLYDMILMNSTYEEKIRVLDGLATTCSKKTYDLIENKIVNKLLENKDKNNFNLRQEAYIEANKKMTGIIIDIFKEDILISEVVPQENTQEVSKENQTNEVQKAPTVTPISASMQETPVQEEAEKKEQPLSEVATIKPTPTVTPISASMHKNIQEEIKLENPQKYAEKPLPESLEEAIKEIADLKKNIAILDNECFNREKKIQRMSDGKHVYRAPSEKLGYLRVYLSRIEGIRRKYPELRNNISSKKNRYTAITPEPIETTPIQEVAEKKEPQIAAKIEIVTPTPTAIQEKQSLSVEKAPTVTSISAPVQENSQETLEEDNTKEIIIRNIQQVIENKTKEGIATNVKQIIEENQTKQNIASKVQQMISKKNIKVTEIRKAKNRTKLIKSLVAASLAIITSLSVINIVNKNKNNLEIPNTSSIVQQDGNNDKHMDNVYNFKQKVINPHIQSKEEKRVEARKREIKEEKISNESSNQSLFIGKQVMVKEGSLIYKNGYDSMNNKNGLPAYFDNNKPRYIMGFLIRKSDSKFAFSINKNEIDDLLNNDGTIESVLVGDENGYEGFYQPNDIVEMNMGGKHI